MSITVISCSLHPNSRSFVLARQFCDEAKTLGVEAKLIDLRERDIPFCDGVDSYDHPEAVRIKDEIAAASTIILSVPIYNFDVNAACKNLLELGLRAWNDKLVGFLCAAGGKSSYMSVMGCANNLMLDFRCIIIPRFVYATGDDFGDDRTASMFIESEAVAERVRELAVRAVELNRALA